MTNIYTHAVLATYTTYTYTIMHTLLTIHILQYNNTDLIYGWRIYNVFFNYIDKLQVNIQVTKMLHFF